MTLIVSLVLTIICTIGILFNGYTVLVILLTRQIHTASDILLLHLGIVNILIGCLYLLFCLPGLKETEWITAGAPCAINGFLFTVLHPLAVWTICGMNFDRYYAIVSPLHYTHIVSSKKILLGLAAGWVNSFLLAIPPLFNAAPYRYLQGLTACAPDFRTGVSSIWYATAFVSCTLLFPATVLIGCNVKILLVARYHRHRIASAIFQVAFSAQVTITHQRNPLFIPSPPPSVPRIRGSNPILTVVILVGSFLAINVPYYVLLLYDAFHYALIEQSEKVHIDYFYTVAGMMMLCSPVINGYLYGLRNRSIRKAFMNYWRKKQSKNEVNHEIQARTPSTCGSRRPSLTPFGVLTKNQTVSRRLSETLFDVKGKTKRNPSELIWRPSSANSINVSPKEELPSKGLKQTISCNTLRVPEEPDEEAHMLAEKNMFEPKPCSPGALLHRIFKFEQEKTRSAKSKRDFDGCRSPRILITRAYSEESDKNSQASSPCRVMNKKHSNSASNLIEKKWRQIKYQDEDTDSDCNKSNSTTKALLGSSTFSNKSSDSSDSSGKIYNNIDSRRLSIDVSEPESNEDQLLLWNSHKRYNRPEDARRSPKSTILKVTVQTKEIVL